MSPNLATTSRKRFRVRGLFLSAFILSMLGLAAGARAEVLAADAAFQATLDAVNVIIYYHPTNDGYQVVVTAGTQDPVSTVRSVSTLMPGQEVVVSVPRGVQQPALELRLRRVGDQMEVLRPAA
ncbi:MAG TPA: hypothetical protein VKP60_14885 [Magnetospirillaceae bacterium]|nr:hypothetical protein [Magnetospirillaceae bacterium]